MRDLLKDSDRRRPSRNHRRPHSNRRSENDGYSSGTSHVSSSATDKSTEFDRIKRRKEKKRKKESNLLVNSPIALGWKNAIQKEPAKSAALTNAVIRRTKRPKSTTINSVYKDDSIVVPDHPIINLGLSGNFSVELQRHWDKNTEKGDKLYYKLKGEYEELKDLLMMDQPLVNPKALYATLTSLINTNTNLFGVVKGYKDQRDSLLMMSENQWTNIGRIDGFCFGYNFKMGGCKLTNCSYDHSCLLHDVPVKPHPTMKCEDNSQRWSEKELLEFNEKKKAKKKPFSDFNNFKFKKKSGGDKYRRDGDKDGNRERYQRQTYRR